jgi:hypothetical protein
MHARSARPRRVAPRLAAVALALVAGSAAQAEVVIGGLVTWPAGSTQVLADDTRFIGSLTIEPGVTVLIRGDFELRIGSGATLTALGTEAQPIVFTSDVSARWGGIAVLRDGIADIEHAVITRTADRAVRVDGGDASLRNIRCQTGAEPFSPPMLVRLFDVQNGGHLDLFDSTIGPYSGTKGTTGSTGSNGTALSQNAGNGGNGGTGSSVRVVEIGSGGTANIANNRFVNVIAGYGGTGGTGGTGGPGRNGAPGSLASPTGDRGGQGGDGGDGGVGGAGGALNLFFLNNPGPVLISQNVIGPVRGGDGGRGGRGGSGGKGGKGGAGSSAGFAPGDGGRGGRGGTGGNGRTGGVAGAVEILRVSGVSSGDHTVRFINNTVAAMDAGGPGAGGEAGMRGSPGPGGPGGSTLFGTGDSGDVGATGTNGTAGAAGGPAFATGLIASTSATGFVEHFAARNNILSFTGANPGPRTAYVMTGPQFSSTDFDIVFNQTQIVSGTVLLGGDSLFADPMLDANFVPLPGSPAIDSGDNDEVPAALAGLDFLGNDRFQNDPHTADTGIGSGAIVDRGAIEVQSDTPACPADLNGDGVADFGDVSAFVSAFGSSDTLADINNDGVVDFGDVSAFLDAFNAGC